MLSLHISWEWALRWSLFPAEIVSALKCHWRAFGKHSVLAVCVFAHTHRQGRQGRQGLRRLPWTFRWSPRVLSGPPLSMLEILWLLNYRILDHWNENSWIWDDLSKNILSKPLYMYIYIYVYLYMCVYICHHFYGMHCNVWAGHQTWAYHKLFPVLTSERSIVSYLQNMLSCFTLNTFSANWLYFQN